MSMPDFDYPEPPTDPDPEREDQRPVCVHCGQDVFWGLPRPEDPCIECGKPIGVR